MENIDNNKYYHRTYKQQSMMTVKSQLRIAGTIIALSNLNFVAVQAVYIGHHAHHQHHLLIGDQQLIQTGQLSSIESFNSVFSKLKTQDADPTDSIGTSSTDDMFAFSQIIAGGQNPMQIANMMEKELQKPKKEANDDLNDDAQIAAFSEYISSDQADEVQDPKKIAELQKQKEAGDKASQELKELQENDATAAFASLIDSQVIQQKAEAFKGSAPEEPDEDEIKAQQLKTQQAAQLKVQQAKQTAINVKQKIQKKQVILKNNFKGINNQAQDHALVVSEERAQNNQDTSIQISEEQQANQSITEHISQANQENTINDVVVETQGVQNPIKKFKKPELVKIKFAAKKAIKAPILAKKKVPAKPAAPQIRKAQLKKKKLEPWEEDEEDDRKEEELQQKQKKEQDEKLATQMESDVTETANAKIDEIMDQINEATQNINSQSPDAEKVEQSYAKIEGLLNKNFLQLQSEIKIDSESDSFHKQKKQSAKNDVHLAQVSNNLLQGISEKELSQMNLSQEQLQYLMSQSQEEIDMAVSQNQENQNSEDMSLEAMKSYSESVAQAADIVDNESIPDIKNIDSMSLSDLKKMQMQVSKLEKQSQKKQVTNQLTQKKKKTEGLQIETEYDSQKENELKPKSALDDKADAVNSDIYDNSVVKPIVHKKTASNTLKKPLTTKNTKIKSSKNDLQKKKQMEVERIKKEKEIQFAADKQQALDQGYTLQQAIQYATQEAALSQQSQDTFGDTNTQQPDADSQTDVKPMVGVNNQPHTYPGQDISEARKIQTDVVETSPEQQVPINDIQTSSDQLSLQQQIQQEQKKQQIIKAAIEKSKQQNKAKTTSIKPKKIQKNISQLEDETSQAASSQQLIGQAEETNLGDSKLEQKLSKEEQAEQQAQQQLASMSQEELQAALKAQGQEQQIDQAIPEQKNSPISIQAQAKITSNQIQEIQQQEASDQSSIQQQNQQSNVLQLQKQKKPQFVQTKTNDKNNILKQKLQVKPKKIAVKSVISSQKKVQPVVAKVAKNNLVQKKKIVQAPIKTVKKLSPSQVKKTVQMGTQQSTSNLSLQNAVKIIQNNSQKSPINKAIAQTNLQMQQKQQKQISIPQLKQQIIVQNQNQQIQKKQIQPQQQQQQYQQQIQPPIQQQILQVQQTNQNQQTQQNQQQQQVYQQVQQFQQIQQQPPQQVQKVQQIDQKPQQLIYQQQNVAIQPPQIVNVIQQQNSQVQSQLQNSNIVEQPIQQEAMQQAADIHNDQEEQSYDNVTANLDNQIQNLQQNQIQNNSSKERTTLYEQNLNQAQEYIQKAQQEMKNIDTEVATFHQKMDKSMHSLIQAFTQGFESIDKAKSQEALEIQEKKLQREKERENKLKSIHSGISNLEQLTSQLKMSFDENNDQNENQELISLQNPQKNIQEVQILNQNQQPYSPNQQPTSSPVQNIQASQITVSQIQSNQQAQIPLQVAQVQQQQPLQQAFNTLPVQFPQVKLQQTQNLQQLSNNYQPYNNNNNVQKNANSIQLAQILLQGNIKSQINKL